MVNFLQLPIWQDTEEVFKSQKTDRKYPMTMLCSWEVDRLILDMEVSTQFLLFLYFSRQLYESINT